MFGSSQPGVCADRQRQLQTYLNSVVQRCHAVPGNPLHGDPGTSEALCQLSSFFVEDNNAE